MATRRSDRRSAPYADVNQAFVSIIVHQADEKDETSGDFQITL
jgi:hypothetical protein